MLVIHSKDDAYTKVTYKIISSRKAHNVVIFMGAKSLHKLHEFIATIFNVAAISRRFAVYLCY